MLRIVFKREYRTEINFKILIDEQSPVCYSTMARLVFRPFFYALKISKIKRRFDKKIQANTRGGGKMRTRITLACTECKQRNYNTTKDKKTHPDRMETKKYCRFCKAHTLHKETK